MGQWIHFRNHRSSSWTRAKVLGHSMATMLYDLGFEHNSLTNYEVWLALPDGKLRQVQWINSLPKELAKRHGGHLLSTEERFIALATEATNDPVSQRLISNGIHLAVDIDSTLMITGNVPLQPSPFESSKELASAAAHRSLRIAKDVLRPVALTPLDINAARNFKPMTSSYGQRNKEVIVILDDDVEQPAKKVPRKLSGESKWLVDAGDVSRWIISVLKATPSWSSHTMSRR